MYANFKQIRKLIDFKAIKQAKLKLAVELMYGTGRGYLDTLLEEAGAEVTLFHDELNPLFGGHHPEPNADGMDAVSRFVRSGKAQLGLGLDGDADRFGIVDKDGAWLTPNQILALALYHLKKNRGWTGAVVRTVPTSHQVDAVAEMLGVKVHETPVGFKYIGALMESEPIIVGGEESSSSNSPWAMLCPVLRSVSCVVVGAGAAGRDPAGAAALRGLGAGAQARRAHARS